MAAVAARVLSGELYDCDQYAVQTFPTLVQVTPLIDQLFSSSSPLSFYRISLSLSLSPDPHYPPPPSSSGVSSPSQCVLML